jgi:hypothetical protein
MTNTAKWKTPILLTEMLQRRDVYGHTYDQIADAHGLNRAQVYYAISQIQGKLWSDEPALQAKQEQREIDITQKLLAELGEPPSNVVRRGPGRPRSMQQALSPEQCTELDAEIAGCIDLVKQAASQFGISARQFLHACITNARSA